MSTTEQRHISPAVGDFALAERPGLLAKIARLETELSLERALLADARAQFNASDAERRELIVSVCNAKVGMNRFDYSLIPPHMMAGLRRYIDDHCPVGDFLTAVLSNDLREACSRADDTNIEIIPVYVAYLYNNAPAPCWGSPARVKAWLNPVPQINPAPRPAAYRTDGETAPDGRKLEGGA